MIAIQRRQKYRRLLRVLLTVSFWSLLLIYRVNVPSAQCRWDLRLAPAMTAFPLFRLSHLPLKVILDGMCPKDLTMLYLCSEKTQKIMGINKKRASIELLSVIQKEERNVMEKFKLLRVEIQNDPHGSSGCFRNDSIKITINITDNLGIQIENSNGNKYNGCFPLLIELMPIDDISTYSGKKNKKSSLKLDGITVPVRMTNKKQMHTFWKDPLNGLKILVNYFKGFFNSQTIGYFMDKCYSTTFSRNLRAVVNGMNQHTIGCCVIKNKIKNDDYKFILDNVKPTIRFRHYCHFPSGMNNFRHETRFQSEYLLLNPAHWFTLDNLINTSCEHITLLESKLTTDDMSKYLKLWMNGKYPKLKQLTVQLEDNLNLGDILSELQSYRSRYAVVREANSILIKQRAATVATITKNGNYSSKYMIEFSVT